MNTEEQLDRISLLLEEILKELKKQNNPHPLKPSSGPKWS